MYIVINGIRLLNLIRVGSIVLFFFMYYMLVLIHMDWLGQVLCPLNFYVIFLFFNNRVKYVYGPCKYTNFSF